MHNQLAHSGAVAHSLGIATEADMQKIWHTLSQGITYNDDSAIGWSRYYVQPIKPGTWTVMYCGGIEAMNMFGIETSRVAAVMDDFGNLVKVDA